MVFIYTELLFTGYLAEEILQEQPLHLYMSRPSTISIKETSLKDGTKAFNETFLLASKKIISTFHRTETPPDHSDLQGKKTFFVITKERLNPYTNEIDYSGRPATIDELREIQHLIKELIDTNGETKNQSFTAFTGHIEKPDVKPVSVSSTPSPSFHSTKEVKETAEIGKSSVDLSKTSAIKKNISPILTPQG